MNPRSRAKQKEFDNATHYHIIRKPSEGDRDPTKLKVHDNDHVTGWFIVASHQQ